MRAREKISAAQRAAQQGDRARARTLLRSARAEVRKALSVAVFLLARKRDFACGSELIFDQLQRLRLLKALTRDVPSGGGALTP